MPKLGTADWNVVGPAWGVRVAAHGPGDSRLRHSDQEHIALPEFWAAVDVPAAAVLEPALAEPALAGGPVPPTRPTRGTSCCPWTARSKWTVNGPSLFPHRVFVVARLSRG
ncbi:hypothetical protein [Streptomyces olivochromogenes]|uniref:hypothetical protein n=1 Tax=Streptomyces olivochromogenes TaxID=1963 RepID=UPI0036A16D40